MTSEDQNLGQKVPKTIPALGNLALLVSIIVSNVGFWCTIDFPQNLADPLMSALHITTKQIGFLNGLYSMVNLVAAPIGGVVITKLGIPNSLLLFSFLIFIGSFGGFLGVSLRSFNTLVVGRIIFAIGGESYVIAQAAACEKWYSGKMLSVVFGLVLTSGLASASLSNFMNPVLLVLTRSVETPFFCYTCVSAFAFGMSSLFVWLDWKYEHILRAEKLEEEAYDEDGEKKSALAEISEQEVKEGLESQSEYKFELRDLLKLGGTFWCSCLIYSIVANCYYQFSFIITNTAVHRYNYTYLKAKNFLSLIQMLSIILMPINSIIIFKFGKKFKMILFAVVMMLLAYITLLNLPAQPTLLFELSMYFLALFYSIYQSTIWSCLTISLPEGAVSIGLGISSVFQAVPMSSLPLFFGAVIKDQKKSQYQQVLWMLTMLTAASILLMFLSIWVDAKNDGILDFPENSNEAKRAKRRLNRRFHGLPPEKEAVDGLTTKGSRLSYKTIENQTYHTALTENLNGNQDGVTAGI